MALIWYSQQTVLTYELKVNFNLGSLLLLKLRLFLLFLLLCFVAYLNDVFDTHVLEDALLVKDLVAVNRATLYDALLVLNQALAQKTSFAELR